MGAGTGPLHSLGPVLLLHLEGRQVDWQGRVAGLLEEGGEGVE